MNTEQLKAKQERIKSLLFAWCDDENSSYICLMQDLNELGVVIAVDEELPYKWDAIKRKHSYHPFKPFTTYALISREGGKMFGYVQKYQSLTGYECFEKPVRFNIYLGNADSAISEKSFPKLKKAREHLVKLFMGQYQIDRRVPEGYHKTYPLVS